ncbi:MAG: hypothetical protein JF571_06970 [Asticcacaulis sp.]|nr:hypothetical protein [Asticcacaulis sp.]
MKYVRWFLVIVVVAYAAWIAFPVVKAFLFPTDMGGAVPTISADRSDFNAAGTAPMDGDSGAPLDSIQGDTAVDAIATHNTPVVFLWGAVIVLYVGAALLHANGNIRAALVYGLGFIADLILTYLTNGSSGGSLQDKLFNVLSGWDPRYVLTLVALVLGFLVYMSRDSRRWKALRTAPVEAE